MERENIWKNDTPTVEEIDLWLVQVVRGQGWWNDSDRVLEGIFHLMENTGPCNGFWLRRPTVKWSYIRLVEIGCERLRESREVEKLQTFLNRVLIDGIAFLDEGQKRRFAEQLAWLLNIDVFHTLVESMIAPYDSLMPDNAQVLHKWMEARNEYKRRHPG